MGSEHGFFGVSSNGRPWRLRVKLPAGYGDHAPELFGWLRDQLIPALLSAPVQITLVFEPPESDRAPE